ncbi:MAG: hypothetical protein WCE30_00965, partial [Mycobacterium sp.]
FRGVGVSAASAAEMTAGWRARQANKSPMNVALRARLCAVDPVDQSAVAHVGALLAFTPSVVRNGGLMVFSFNSAATGEWAVRGLGDAHARLINNEDGSARVFVFNAPSVLSRFGFRDGNWQFGRSTSDAAAICLGALHAGGSVNKHGLKITCPTSALLLTLMAVLARLGSTATPMAATVGVSLVPREFLALLNRLGLDDIADQYAQMVGPKMLGVRS